MPLFLQSRVTRFAQVVSERLDVPIRGIIVDSVSPPNFTIGDPAHQIVAHLENAAHGTVLGTLTYGTTNASVVTVTAGGAVTPAGSGTASITINSTGVPQVSVSFSVTNPIGTVHHIDISAATLALDVGAAANLTATPRTSGNDAVLGQTLTWSEVSGAGDVTLTNYAGPETHQIRVQGVTAGTRVIRVTHTPTGVFTDCTVTVSTATSYVHPTLGITFPLLESTGWVQIHGRLMGSTLGTPLSTPTGATRSTTHDPFYTSYCEGCDNAKESHLSLMTDAAGPHQAARDILYPGNGTRCIRMRMDPGAVGNSGYSQFGTFQTSSTNRWTDFPGGSAAANKNWRRLYVRWDVMFEHDYSVYLLNKMGFVGMGNPGGSSADNCVLMQIPSGSSPITLQNAVNYALGPYRLNLQGVEDNSLVANIGDRGGQINATWSASTPGNTLPTQVTGGQAFTFLRGHIYSIERKIFGGTKGSTDGWHKLQIRELLSINPDVWSTPVLLHGPDGCTGLDLDFNENPDAPGVQSYWRSYQLTLQNQYTFPGTGRFTRSGNHAIVTTINIPCRVSGTSFTLASGSSLTLPAKTLGASRWGVCKVCVDSAGVMQGTWLSGDFANEQTSPNIGSTPPSGQEEIGWISVQASSGGWTAGTDALTGGTGGTPALTTNYMNRSGVRTYLSYLAMSETAS